MNSILWPPLTTSSRDVGLSRAEAGATVSLTGQDPILPAAHRLGACIAVPIMAGAVAAVAFHRHRRGPAQHLELDLRQAVHAINPGAFWHPTLNGETAPHPLVLDNPFLITPYRTADGRWVMASGVYPHMVARWCRFLDVPPDPARVAEAIASWDAFELEEAATASGLPVCGRAQSGRMARPRAGRTPGQPTRHRAGADRRGAGPGLRTCRAALRRGTRAVVHPRCRRPHRRPDPGRARSRRAVRHPTQRLRARVHLRRGQRRIPKHLPRPRQSSRPGEGRGSARNTPTSWSTTTAADRWSVVVSNPDNWPNGIRVSCTCRSPATGRPGPWAQRGGFDMNGSAASGLMTTEGNDARAQASRHRADQRLHHRLHGCRSGPPPHWSSAPPRAARGTSPST